MPLPLQLQCLLVFAAGWVNRHQQAVIDYLLAENRVLREQLGPKRPSFTLAQRRRLAGAGKALGKKLLGEYAQLATPDTILRWWRELVARKYDGASSRGVGRPRTPEDVADLVVRVARESPRWGYTRIRDALANLGTELARTTVARILRDRGIVPAPERGRKTSWTAFLRAHWATLAAADFLSVEVLTWTGLVRYQVFFVMRLATRRVEIAGIVRDTGLGAGWIQQVGRNLTDAADGFLLGVTHLILDRDPAYTRAFRQLLASSGVEVVRLPRASPNLNAFAERWILGARAEALDRLVLFGERHLRHVLAEYLVHYHRERNHQGLDGALIDPDPAAGRTVGAVRSRERLGGLLQYYYRAAA